MTALGLCPNLRAAAESDAASIAITLDLEMSRNFPQWTDTRWDYEKGNLDDATKRYAVEAGRRVRERGGRIHYFCVGRVLEQPDVTWLEGLAKDGHAIDNRDFRTPGGFATGLQGREDLQTMLLDSGFKWVSSKYPPHANTRPNERPTAEIYGSIVEAKSEVQPFVYPTGLVEVPMSPISDIGAFRNGRWELDWFLEAIRRAVAWTIEHRAVFDFLAHPSCLVAMDPEFRAIDLICDLVQQSGGRATLVNLDAIAQKLSTG
jgi:hypothetical protein